MSQAFLTMTDRESNGIREHIQHRQEIESLQKALLASKETIRRFRLEKKELLKTNFVGRADLETQLGDPQDEGAIVDCLGLQAVHVADQEDSPRPQRRPWRGDRKDHQLYDGLT